MHRPVARLLHFATSDGSGATFRCTPPPNTSHGFLHSVFACLSVLGIAHPTIPALCGNGRLRWKSLITGYTDPIATGGLLWSVSVLWRDRKLDDAHMPKEVTRKPYFRHSAGQSTSLLVSFGNQRSRGNHTCQKNHPPCTRPPSTSHASATIHLSITPLVPAHF